MSFDRNSRWFFIAFAVIGAVLGSALGTLLVRIFPALSILTYNLTGPVGFSLEFISFSLKISLSTIAGALVGLLVFRKI